MSTVVEHVLAAPSRYVQGRNVIQKLGSHLKPLGSTPLLVADDVVWEIVEDSLTKGFEEADLPVTRVGFGKFATAEAVDSLVETLRNGDHDVIAGIGGGSAIDAVKAAGHLAGISWASVPTAASSDAPTSALAVIYTDEGEFVEYRFFPKNPDLVLIDTVLVANAPERFLVGGIGDALATWVEARAVAKTRAQTMVGDAPTHTGTALAELSWKILWENALDALDAVRSRTVTPALEAVVEANTLLSGLGFESGGLAAAHAIHNGMTAAPQTHGLTHGEKVNIGTLTQLIMEGAPSAEIEDFIVFSTKVGLPNSLAEIGLAPEDRKEIRAIAEAATVGGETIHNMPFTVTPELVAEAMTVAETLSRRIRAEHGLPEPQLYQAEH